MKRERREGRGRPAAARHAAAIAIHSEWQPRPVRHPQPATSTKSERPARAAVTSPLVAGAPTAARHAGAERAAGAGRGRLALTQLCESVSRAKAEPVTARHDGEE